MTGWIIAVCVLAAAGLTVQLFRVRGQLWASREAFEVLSRRAPVGILQADAEGMCTFANQAWCELSGLTCEQTLGHRWSQAIHPADLETVMNKWEASVRGQEPYVNEVRLIRPDGSIRHVLAGGCPTRDDQGRVSGFIGTVLDITGLDHARRDLAERERLLRSLLDVQEAEKQLLCHEFHDGLIQYAVGSKMLLEGLRESDLPETCRTAIDSVIECLAKGIEDGRRVIRGIRPAALDDLGLRAALEELADELRESGVEVEAAFDAAIDEIPPGLQTTVYRVVQESLNNVRKHSGSRRLRMAVGLTSGDLQVSVEDFGRGFDPAAATKGFGLVGLRERVRLAGGECRVEAKAGQGTRLAVRLPLPASA